MFELRCSRPHVTVRNLTAAVAAVVLVGCSAGAGGSAAPASSVVRHGPLVTPPVAERVAAPDLSGPTVDGGRVAWADYRGKVVVLNTWASWCDPCREEAGDLRQAYARYRDRGVAFLGINTREPGRDGGQGFEKEFGIEYPSLHDSDGSVVLRFPRGTVTPQGIPNTLVVDRNGNLAAWALHQVGPEDLDALIAPVLAEQP